MPTVCIRQSQSPNSSHPTLPPWCPYVCSLHLCLYFCLANKIALCFLKGLLALDKQDDFGGKMLPIQDTIYKL